MSGALGSPTQLGLIDWIHRIQSSAYHMPPIAVFPNLFFVLFSFLFKTMAGDRALSSAGLGCNTRLVGAGSGDANHF